MKKLMIAIVAAGLLGGSALALAEGPGVGASGYHKVGDRDESPLERKILRARHPDHRDHARHRPHHRDWKHQGRWKKDRHGHKKRWHHKHHHHGWHRGSGHRQGGYHGQRRYGQHYYPHGLYFGIADGQRGVVIWNR